MSKKHTHRLPTVRVATVLGMPHATIMQALESLIGSGHIAKSRARTLNTALMDATLDLGDILLLSAHLQITVDQAAAILDDWKDGAGSIYSADRAASAEPPSMRKILYRLLGTKPAFVQMVRDAIAGDTDRDTTWRRHGFIVERDVLMLATSHPFVSAMLHASGVSNRTLNSAIAILPGGDRGGIKKVSGKNYRVAECEASAFLEAITAPEATHDP